MQKILPAILLGILLQMCNSDYSDQNKLSSFILSFADTIKNYTSQEITQSPFGVQYNGMPFHTNAEYDSFNHENLLQHIPVTAQAASDLGVKWARVSVDWSSIEDNAGTFHWEILDEIVNELTRRDIEIYLCLHGGHRIHTDFRPPVNEQELESWGNYVESTVQRYTSKIDYWEIWNEPNTIWFWNNNPDADEYLNLVKFTERLINQNDDNPVIIGGSLARLDLPFAKALFDRGIGDYIDVFTFHPYGHFPEGIVRRIDMPVQTPHWYIPADHQVEDLIETAENANPDIQVWQGECGYPSKMNTMGWNGTGPYSDRIQGKWIMRRALVDLSFGSQISCYFLMKESKGGNNRMNYKGLLQAKDNSKKPAYFVYQNLIGTLKGSFTPVENMSADFTIIDEGGYPGVQEKDIFSVLLQDSSGKQYFGYNYVVRMQNDIPHSTVNLKLNNTVIRNPVLIDMIEGKKYTINDYSYSNNSLIMDNLPIADYPFFITSE